MSRPPRVPFALLVTALLVGGLGLLLALNTASAANELERHDLATKDQQVAAQVQQSRNEVALSAAPGNLARAAAALGMVPAGNPAFIVLGPGGSVKVLGKPKAVVGVPLQIAPAPTKPPATKTSRATPSSTTRAKPSATTSSSRTRTSSTKTSGRPSHGTRSSTAKTSPRPTPTPTPTPTVTLPGGPR